MKSNPIHFRRVLLFSWLLLAQITLLKSQTGSWFKTEAPRFRNTHSVWMHSPADLVLAGGWLTNDSITGIYTSADSGKTWELRMDNLGSQLYSLCFTSRSLGYACGKYGRFVKTTDGGSTWSNANISAYPNADARAMVNKGADSLWIAGGSIGSNHSRIYFSANRGVTWTLQLDSQQGLLKSLAVSPDGSLWAGGVSGLLYKSVNNGQNWQRVYLPAGVRTDNINAICFTASADMWLAGGHSSSDTAQVIVRMRSGSFQVFRDTAAPELNSIHFFSNTEGYAAGNAGQLLYSPDGSAWRNIRLSGGINDNRDLMDVMFINRYHGLVAGLAGKTLHYVNRTAVLPKVQILKVSVTNRQIRVEAQANPEGLSGKVTLHYGTDINTSLSLPQVNCSGNNWQPLVFTLEPAAGYYYLKLSVQTDAGTVSSGYQTAYNGTNEIPNFDFESWDQQYQTYLADWNTAGRLTQISGGGKKRLLLKGGPGLQTPGAVFFGTPNDDGLSGGMPFTAKPTALHLKCNYKISAGDSAHLLAVFKNNSGTPVFTLNHKWTGVRTTDTTFIVPVNIPPGQNVDTLILAVISTNVFRTAPDTASTLNLDTIWFAGAPGSLPNAGFTRWKTDTLYVLQGWSDESLARGNMQTVFRSQSAKHGSFAAELRSTASERTFPGLSVKPYDPINYNRPKFRVSQRYTSFRGYVDFRPGTSGDSLYVRAGMFTRGRQIGWCERLYTQNTGGFKAFNLTIQYSDTGRPDSASISFNTMNRARMGLGSNATAAVDWLSFENWLDSIPAGRRTAAAQEPFFLYPNPAGGLLYFSAPIRNRDAALTIYDPTGRLLLETTLQQGSLHTDISALPTGTLICVIRDGELRHIHQIIHTP